MRPILFGEGMWAVPSYFAMVALGFFLAFLLLRFMAKKNGYKAYEITDLFIVIAIAAVLGARLAHVLFDGYLSDYVALCFDPDALARTPSAGLCLNDDMCLAAQNNGEDVGSLCKMGTCVPERDCLRVLKFTSGGLTYYGGFLAAFLASYIFCKRKKWQFTHIADLAAPGIALGLFFGRIGCFLAGCCFGTICDHGVSFPSYSDAWLKHRELYPERLAEQFRLTGENVSLPVHPTQLYEAFGSLVIFVVLLFVLFFLKDKLKRGTLIASLLILYGSMRFAIEFFRDDERGGYWLSTSQWISIPLIVLGCYLLVRNPGTSSTPETKEPHT